MAGNRTIQGGLNHVLDVPFPPPKFPRYRSVIESGTSGKAGGLLFAGPSKGPDRKHENQKPKLPLKAKRNGHGTLSPEEALSRHSPIGQDHIPGTVKLQESPGKAGGLPIGNYSGTSRSLPSGFIELFKNVPPYMSSAHGLAVVPKEVSLIKAGEKVKVLLLDRGWEASVKEGL